MGWICPSVRLSVTPLLQYLENHMSKGNKGNRPEQQLAALLKQAVRGHQFIRCIEYLEAQFTYGILHFTNKLMS